ncbi:BrnA antitoxin family protein [bacterium]|nr:BrnA antitoxin family protein [bacterium]MBU1614703.1 BrnA antitoxin family protein [bacterium]
MEENKAKTMPHFNSLNELVGFFDAHDLGEYWDQMPEVHFDVDIKKRSHLFTLDDELANKLTEVAKLKHIPSEMLINSWLREKVLSQQA